MTKRIRPSLKDYLRTGEVRTEVFETQETPVPESLPPRTREKKSEASSRTKQAASQKSKTEKRPPQAKERRSATKTTARAKATPSVADSFLNSLTEADRATWVPVLSAGSEVTELPLDFIAVREDFRTMDRNRFTCYILDRKGADLRPVRSSVQIREPLELLLKWDELGVLILFRPHSASA